MDLGLLSGSSKCSTVLGSIPPGFLWVEGQFCCSFFLKLFEVNSESNTDSIMYLMYCKSIRCFHFFLSPTLKSCSAVVLCEIKHKDRAFPTNYLLMIATSLSYFLERVILSFLLISVFFFCGRSQSFDLEDLGNALVLLFPG